MTGDKIYKKLKDALFHHVEGKNLLGERIVVTGRTLTAEEAIGNPDRQDFPLIKGREKLMQPEFRGALGQVFTDMPGNFEGTLKDIIEGPIESNFDRAVFIATFNALMSYLGKAKATIHCKDNEPEDCATKLGEYIRKNYGNPRIALVGYQPSFLESLASQYNIRVLDLDDDQIGTEKFGVLLEDGEDKMLEVIEWCDIVVATGSTLANGSIVNYLDLDKPVIFYGTTIAAAAEVLGLERFCECAK